MCHSWKLLLPIGVGWGFYFIFNKEHYREEYEMKESLDEGIQNTSEFKNPGTSNAFFFQYLKVTIWIK